MTDRRFVHPLTMSRFIPLIGAALPLAGCRLDDWLRSDRQTLLWLALPLLGFALVGGFLVHYRRRGQLAAWDLRLSPEEPSSHAIVMATMAVAGGVAVLFAAYNFFFIAAIKPLQQLLNVGLWLAGTLVGGAMALLAGLRSAEPRRLGAPRPGRK